MRLELSKETIYNLIYILGAFFIFIYFLNGGLVFFIIYVFLGMLGFLFFQSYNLIYLSIFIFNIFLLFVFGWGSVNFKINYFFINILYLLSSVGFVLLLISMKNPVLITKINYSIISIFVLFYLFFLGFDNPDLYNNIFENRSRNVVSAYLNFLLIIYIISCYLDDKKVNFYLVWLNFLLGIILFGRSGIILSFGLLVLSIFYFSNKKYLNFYLISFLILFIFFGDFLYTYLNENTNFVLGSESERSIVLSEYISGIVHLKDIVLGVDISKCCSYLPFLDYNLHNSFLYFHSRFGIYSLFLLLISIFWVLISKNLFFIILFALMLFRYFYDELGFFSSFDIALFYLIFICNKKYEVKKNSFS